MSNDLLITGNGPMQLPAYLAGNNNGVTTNLMEGMYTGGNRIGLKGSRFRLVVSGVEEGVIQEAYLDTIFLGAAPAVSRVYYEGSYKPGENVPPTCYSADGITPAADVKQKQSDKCMTCPMNAVGSKIVDGKKHKACGYFRRSVVMLAGDTDQRTVFKLDLKSQSLWGDSGANEKNFTDYVKMLATRGVDAGNVVTRISFDTDASVPKLLFKAARFVTEEEAAVVNDLVHSVEVQALKEVSMSTLDVSNEEPTSGDREEAPEPAPERTPAPQRAATQRPAPQQATTPAPQRAAPQRQAAAVVESNVPAPQRQAVTKPAQPKPAAAPAPQVQEVDTDDELAALLESL